MHQERLAGIWPMPTGHQRRLLPTSSVTAAPSNALNQRLCPLLVPSLPLTLLQLLGPQSKPVHRPSSS